MHCDMFYVTISQVMDDSEGWRSFRSDYGEETFRYLTSAYPGTPWILASATLDDSSIASILESIGSSR